MSKKYTEGQWNVGEWTPCNGADAVEVLGENGEFIALVYTDIDAGQSNAALIASAPELLETIAGELDSLLAMIALPEVVNFLSQDDVFGAYYAGAMLAAAKRLESLIKRAGG